MRRSRARFSPRVLLTMWADLVSCTWSRVLDLVHLAACTAMCVTHRSGNLFHPMYRHTQRTTRITPGSSCFNDGCPIVNQVVRWSLADLLNGRHRSRDSYLTTAPMPASAYHFHPTDQIFYNGLPDVHGIPRVKPTALPTLEPPPRAAPHAEKDWSKLHLNEFHSIAKERRDASRTRLSGFLRRRYQRDSVFGY